MDFVRCLSDALRVKSSVIFVIPSTSEASLDRVMMKRKSNNKQEIYKDEKKAK